jgi:hypothetical protein
MNDQTFTYDLVSSALLRYTLSKMSSTAEADDGIISGCSSACDGDGCDYCCKAPGGEQQRLDLLDVNGRMAVGELDSAYSRLVEAYEAGKLPLQRIVAVLKELAASADKFSHDYTQLSALAVAIRLYITLQEDLVREQLKEKTEEIRRIRLMIETKDAHIEQLVAQLSDAGIK